MIKVNPIQPGQQSLSIQPFVIKILLPLWFFMSVWGGYQHWLGAPSSKLSLGLLAAVAGPIGAFLLLLKLSAPFRTWIRQLDLPLLTAFQHYRIIGVMFLVLMFFGLLPPLFAIPAGAGDVAVGVAALPITRQLTQHPQFQFSRSFLWFNLLGILDFVVAVGAGMTLQILPGNEGMALMTQLPLSLIPGFLVPLFTILHLSTLYQVIRSTKNIAIPFGL